MRDVTLPKEDVQAKDAPTKGGRLSKEYSDPKDGNTGVIGFDKKAAETAGKLPSCFVGGESKGKKESDHLFALAKEEPSKNAIPQLLIDHFEKDKMPVDLAEALSEKTTGVKIDSIDIAHYQEGDMIVGYNKGKQVLLKGNALYANLNQSEINELTARGANFGKSGSKPGWYMVDGDRFRKTLYEEYRFSKRDGMFMSRANDGVTGLAWKPKAKDAQEKEIAGESITGKFNAVGSLVQTDKDGNVMSVRRSNDEEVIQKFAAPVKPGEKPKLTKLTEIDANGRRQEWLPEKTSGDLVFTGADLREFGRRKNFHAETNGNVTWENVPGERTIVRGNGGIIVTGNGHPQFKFDGDGRITDTEGKIKQHFEYVGRTNELAKTETVESKKTETVNLADRETKLPKEERTEKVVRELDQKLSERVRLNTNDPRAIKEYLAKNYNVSFGKPGERYIMHEESTTSQAVHSREPSLRELQIVLQAREKLFGLNTDNKSPPPLRFVFSPSNISNLSNTVTYDHNRVFIPNDWRKLGHGEMMQDFHLDHEPHRESGRLAAQNYSAEGTILHELGHWVDEQRGYRQNTPKYNELVECYGFGEHRGQIGNMGTLAVGLKDKDERSRVMYIPSVSARGESEWLPYSLDGQRLAAAPLNYELLRQRAKIPPGTKYWTNPLEASADAKTCLYLGHASAEGLLKRSPKAYQIARNQDQKDIDWAHGTDNIGNSKMMRAFNGEIVPVTQNNIAARQKAERQMQINIASR